MKSLGILTLIIAATVLMNGCAKDNAENEIQALLENSPYVAEGAYRATHNDPNNSPNLINPLLPDTFTFPINVDWHRRVYTPITRVYNIVVTGDSADVTITSYFYGDSVINQGNFLDYGFTVLNEYGYMQRAEADSAIQYVKMYLDETGWRILSLTAANLYTVGLDNPITINEIRAHVASSGYEFVINDANTYFTKDQLPTFEPDDTVEVTVTITVADDSAWAFLHHGAGHRPAFGLRHHFKDPFYKTSTNTFTRSWVISADSVSYGVRHTAIDVVGWQTIFGDSTAPYYARVWALPYIVKTADQDIPADEE